jgi:hypothetical protein
MSRRRLLRSIIGGPVVAWRRQLLMRESDNASCGNEKSMLRYVNKQK